MLQTALATAGLPNLHYVNAEEQFLKALEGVTAPEAKRRIIVRSCPPPPHPL